VRAQHSEGPDDAVQGTLYEEALSAFELFAFEVFAFEVFALKTVCLEMSACLEY
jgi:hypothetical protein